MRNVHLSRMIASNSIIDLKTLCSKSAILDNSNYIAELLMQAFHARLQHLFFKKGQKITQKISFMIAALRVLTRTHMGEWS